MHHLTSAQQDIRAAAAAALADAAEQHPATIASTLAAVLELFGDDLEEQDDVAASVLLGEAERQGHEQARAALAAARLGVAAGLQALARVLTAEHVHAALDFLVSRGLGEPSDSVREAMVEAGEQLWCYCSPPVSPYCAYRTVNEAAAPSSRVQVYATVY